MDADESIGYCYGAAEEMFADGRLQPLLRRCAPAEGGQSTSISGLEFIDMCRFHGCTNIVPTPTAIVRTALQRHAGGYRSELPHAGDMELWMRLAAHARVGYIGVPQAVYRRHNSNMSLTHDGANRILDLRQRELAVEWLIRGCRHLLPDADRLKRSLLDELARESVAAASAALSEGRTEVAYEFIEFARATSPRVIYSSYWWRLLAKRLMGRRVSGVLLSARDALRKQPG